MNIEPYDLYTSDDSWFTSDHYSGFPASNDDSDDWISSQEYTPIVPLSDSDFGGSAYDFSQAQPVQDRAFRWPDSDQAFPAGDMTASPMMSGPAALMSGSPTAPMADRSSAPMADTSAAPMAARPASFMADRSSAPMADATPALMFDRPASPPPPMPDRPVAPLPPMPDRPVAPLPPRPDRPVMPPPNRPMPPRPNRPVMPPRPVRPNPPLTDWSWNWGVVLPGNIMTLPLARVRFHNAAIPGPIQIYVNNRLVVSNLGYLNFTRYYNVSPGRYRITVYSGANLRTPVVDTWMAFRQNRSYTVTLSGSVSNYWLQSTNP